MTTDLFIDTAKALEQMESRLDFVLKKYYLATCKDKTLDIHGNPLVKYHAQIVFTKRDGTMGTHSVVGNSYPELYQNVSNKF